MCKRTNRGTYKNLDWTLNGTLQLQRLAHEELGLGSWTGTLTSHPVTALGETLAIIDAANSHHPVLVRPASQANVMIRIKRLNLVLLMAKRKKCETRQAQDDIQVLQSNG